MRFHWQNLKDGVARALAWMLPLRVVYWATIRAATIASTGKWRHTEAPAVTITDILKRLEVKP